ncbi:Exonuclease GOR [Vanrija pseudolonga]|uniref:Exonuclease GOR n=1 Tax=Vanrija pseudolonga TaxID=143232 RepID=A0AAF0YKH7_9TREE|nr:Exonuclease GOR [Vanrija pseudolonga]
MFTNLGLFSNYSCPELTCNRPGCVFAHPGPSSTRAPPPTTRPTAPRPLPPTKEAQLAKQFQQGIHLCRLFPLRLSHQLHDLQPHLPGYVPSMHRNLPVCHTLTPTPSSQSSTSATPRSQSGPPMLRIGKSTPQPVSDRQKGLRTLYDQFVKLYGDLLYDHPDLARESAILQEQEISASAGQLKAYKSAIHHAAVSVSRRPPPDSVSHPSIGTVKQSRAATEAAKVKSASRLTRDRIERYYHSPESLALWGYPDSTDNELQHPSTHQVNAEGELHLCGRCKTEFIVSTSQELGDCRYHYGKLAPERAEGRRVWVYSCCRKERGSEGCEDGVHVFSYKEDDKKLAEVEAFKTTRVVREELAKTRELPKPVDVVGMDCEMIYTTSGSSLARVTIVDEDGAALLDELVRPRSDILDLNSRFSGITAEDMLSAVMDLNEVRAAGCAFIGPDTVIVGHGLENDLRALRLLHSKIIDTAILFPHDKGPPYRRALRDLVKEKLGFFIQDRTNESGHSSLEDAKAALDVLKWKVRDDGEP